MVDVKYPNVNIAIELKRILSKMICIEEATIMRITPLILIMKLTQGNIESKVILHICVIKRSYI